MVNNILYDYIMYFYENGGRGMDYTDFEEIICKIDDVSKCKIIASGDELTEIHVLAGINRSPKQISRDIETALLTLKDYSVDRKIISIAQIDTGFKEKLGRIKFEGINLTSFENKVKCEVSLDYEEESYKVVETGIKSSAIKKKIVARSTLKAVEKILDKENIFDVMNVCITNCGDVSFVSVLITMVPHDSEETVVVGSSIIKDDINESIAKASLDAVNRIIQKTNN